MPYKPIIRQRTMKYDSPSGKISIGKWIPPFEPNDTGFGFKGVVVKDFKSGKIQCSVCGIWLQQLGQHIICKHKLTSKEYKRKFGLFSNTALVTDKIRIKHSKIMSELRVKNKSNNFKFPRNNLQSYNRKGEKKPVENLNMYGVCDLQIKQRIKDMTDELGKTPTLLQLRDRYGAGMMTLIHYRYRSYIKLCKDLDLTPNGSNYNPIYSKEYFIEKGLSNDAETRILTLNERRAIYRYFKNVGEWKKIVEEIRSKK